MIKTKNIYYAAYLFTNQITYVGCEVINDIDRKTGAIFSFKAENEEQEILLQKNYETAQANVNIREYIDRLVFVRDIMYKAISSSKGTTTNSQWKEKYQGKSVFNIKPKKQEIK